MSNNGYDLKDVQRAIRIACKAHAKQVDKQGVPYVFHLFAVAGKFQTSREQCVALLHDVLEDTDYSYYDLEWQFPSIISTAVLAITKLDGEHYSDYIERVAKNPIAVAVKIEDLKHNLSRIDRLSPKDQNRLRPKYEGALVRLESIR